MRPARHVLARPLTHALRGALIGEGAFGRVYQAFNSETAETIAAKQIRIGSQEGSTVRLARKIEDEVTLMKKLKHPHIVRYLGAQTEDDPDAVPASGAPRFMRPAAGR